MMRVLSLFIIGILSAEDASAQVGVVSDDEPLPYFNSRVVGSDDGQRPFRPYFPSESAPSPRTYAAPRLVPAPRLAPATPVDLNGKLDDLVWQDSQGWALYSYRRGSIRNTTVTSISADRRTFTLRGDYKYYYGDPGSVSVQFVDGSFSCIQFEDDDRCRGLYTPERAENAKIGLTVAAIGAVALYAISSNSSSASNGSAWSSASNNGGGGGASNYSASRQDEADRRARDEEIAREEGRKRGRVGGANGLYGCVNPKCWDD